MYLPKFKIEYKTDLILYLEGLGMKLTFDKDNANFYDMLERCNQYWILSIIHKTYIKIDEKGTEAAVTPVSIVNKSGKKNKKASYYGY